MHPFIPPATTPPLLHHHLPLTTTTTTTTTDSYTTVIHEIRISQAKDLVQKCLTVNPKDRSFFATHSIADCMPAGLPDCLSSAVLQPLSSVRLKHMHITVVVLAQADYSRVPGRSLARLIMDCSCRRLRLQCVCRAFF